MCALPAKERSSTFDSKRNAKPSDVRGVLSQSQFCTSGSWLSGSWLSKVSHPRRWNDPCDNSLPSRPILAFPFPRNNGWELKLTLYQSPHCFGKSADSTCIQMSGSKKWRHPRWFHQVRDSCWNREHIECREATGTERQNKNVKYVFQVYLPPAN